MKSKRALLQFVTIALGLLWIAGAIMIVSSKGEMPQSLAKVVFSGLCIAQIGGPILVYYLSEDDKLTRAISALIFPFIALPVFGILSLITSRPKSRPSLSRTKEQCPFYRQGFCVTPSSGGSQMLKCSLQYGSYDQDCHVYPINLSKM